MGVERQGTNQTKGKRQFRNYKNISHKYSNILLIVTTNV
jgi:hypothetical protein